MVGREKYLFIINFNKSTYNGEVGHCSMKPGPGILFNCPPTSLLYISLFTRKAKGWDKGNMQSGIVSLL
jgi:hypothetical protein